MKLECFTCQNKQSHELSLDERRQMTYEHRANGERFYVAPEMIFNCKITGKSIRQIDPACDNYKSNKELVEIRGMISKTARKLRNDLSQ